MNIIPSPTPTTLNFLPSMQHRLRHLSSSIMAMASAADHGKKKEELTITTPAAAAPGRRRRLVRGPPPLGSSVATVDQNDSQSSSGEETGVKQLMETAPEMKKLPPQYVLPLSTNPFCVSTDAQIPVIDLSGLDASPPSRTATIQAISSACQLWGFFRIVNHGVDESVMQGMVNAADEFFSMSPTEKMKYASEDVMSPVRYGTSLNSSKKHSLHWRDYFRHYAHPLEEHFHLWPLNPPSYRTAAKAYSEHVWKLAMRIIGAISEGLGVDEGFLERTLLADGFQILAANYYPRCPEPDKTLGLDSHSDHGALTILMDNGISGLQVRHDGEWVAVHHVPASFVVNVGDTLEIVSNGKYRSIEHRATVNGERDRISIAVGHGANLSRAIGPTSPFIENGPKYKSTVYKEYISLQQSSTKRGKSALDTVRISNE